MSDGWKSYLYISDSKVDNLYAQLYPTTPISPHEIKLGPPWLSVGTKGELEPEQKRMVKLNKVVESIMAKGNVGEIDEPSEYVHGTLDMRWGGFDDQGEMGDSKVVWFGGTTDRTVVGLAGSAHNVFGNIGQSRAWSRSNIPALLPYLFRAVEKDPVHQLDREEFWLAEHKPYAHEAVLITTTGMPGIPQTVEFLARRLLFGKSHSRREELVKDRNILLATPIFVAEFFNPYAPMGRETTLNEL